MEKTIAQAPRSPAPVQSTRADDMDGLKKQREALEMRLAETNAKLATARIGEKLN